MKITVRGKNIVVTEAIENAIVSKLTPLEKYFLIHEDVEAKVLIRVYPVGQKIEVTIPTEYVILRAEVTNSDLYQAIDEVVEKLERQIRKCKTRLTKRHEGFKYNLNVDSIPESDEEDNVYVKTKSINPKPMDVEEAVLQMELLGHNFFIYLDVETNAVSVVYKRNDGGYGVVETN